MTLLLMSSFYEKKLVIKSLFCVVIKDPVKQASYKFNDHIAWKIPPKIYEVAVKFSA